MALVKKIAERIRKEVLKLDNVKEGVSRFGSRPSFSVEGREFAHFHNDEELDIRLPFKENKVENAHRNPYTNAWLILDVKSEEDATVALQLIKTAYKRVINEKKHAYG
ncbi:MAG: luciferase family protein [Candidatus Bathyarchaeia archaeon]